MMHWGSAWVRVGFILAFAALYTQVQAKTQHTTNSKSQQDRVILGVLEDLPGDYAGDPDFRVVRAVFEKIDNNWRPFSTKTNSRFDLQTLPRSYPQKMKWTIAFDGRNLGTITSQTPAHFNFYCQIGIEYITSKGQIPTIGKKSTDNNDVFGNDPLYRPLVAISQPNVSDPEQWKPTQLSPELIAIARQQFRIKFPKVTNCRSPEENIPRTWNYQDKDIHVTKAYSSKDGRSLVELNLTGNACDGEQGNQDEYHGQWYLLDPAKGPQFLGEDMQLVDAGDYDNDGKSEVIFAINADNTGGYRLFYDGFQKSAEFIFHYH
jgi:hypothetical protein